MPFLSKTALRRVPLKRITTKIGSGATPRGGKNSYKSKGISLVRSQNVFDFCFVYDGLAFIDETQADGLSNVKVEHRDIFLNITGASVARCCIVPDRILPARVNQHVAIVRVDRSKAYPYYLLCCINSPSYKDYLLAISQGGATREALTKEKIENFEIPLPPLLAQRKIASILSDYEDLIENNMRRIKILEEMAQTLYREWFVKFRFPGHEKVLMVDSPLGKIPEGWEVNKVGGLLKKIRRKKKLKKQYYETDGPIPVVDQGRDFIGGYTTDPETLFDSPLPIIVFGDHTRVLKYVDFPFACGADGTQLLLPNTERMPTSLFFYALRSIDLSDFAYARHFKFLKEQGILVPDEQVAQSFAQVADPIRDQIRCLLRRNANLRRTRDLLLPKLISGELDVSDLDIKIGGHMQ